MALAIHANRIEQQTVWEQIKHYVCRSYHVAEIQNVVNYLNRTPSIDLSERLISHYGNDSSLSPILTVFDRQLAYQRPQFAYHHPENIRCLEKWRKAHLPEDVFHRSPRLVNFLFKSHLIEQIQISRHPAMSYLGNEAALCVEGRWMGETEFFNRFETIYSRRYKQPFIQDRQTRSIYTYLDNGQGLQQYHPYLSSPVPISRLSREEYTALWNRASSFIRSTESHLPQEMRRERNQNRPHILQIVTSVQHRGNTNFHKAILNPRHVYLRLILDNNVYEFGLEVAESFSLPLSLLTARFRSPDLHEYFPSDEKIVTSIPLDLREANSVFRFCERYRLGNIRRRLRVSFHLASHNCTVFLREACRAAGIDIPTEMTIPEILSHAAPDWFHKIENAFKEWKRRAFHLTEKFLLKKHVVWIRKGCERIIEIWYRFTHALISILLFPLRFLLGDAFGEAGLAFDRRRRRFFPPLQNLATYFDFRVNAPSRIQNWQSKQPSTVVFQNPIRLAL